MALPLRTIFPMFLDVVMMPICICFACVVMNGYTLSVWKKRMMYFAEVCQKGSDINFMQQSKSSMGVHCTAVRCNGKFLRRKKFSMT